MNSSCQKHFQISKTNFDNLNNKMDKLNHLLLKESILFILSVNSNNSQVIHIKIIVIHIQFTCNSQIPVDNYLAKLFYVYIKNTQKFLLS